MSSYSHLSANWRQRLSRIFFLVMLASGLLLVGSQAVAAQCKTNPTGETAVGLKNASSYHLTFYIDGVNKGGVPPGDISTTFPVSPGQHSLRADADVDGETRSASRNVDVTKGSVCTWTVSNPSSSQMPRFSQMVEGRESTQKDASSSIEQMKALEGTWREAYYSISPWDAGDWREIQGNPGCHYRIELRGDELFLSQVLDKDTAAALAGEELHYAILKLNGRRVTGKLDKRWPWYKHFDSHDFFGVVSQDFTEFKLSILYMRDPTNYQTMLLRHK
jgi:hypothetical protein